MKIQNILPLTADLSSQSEEKVESDECSSSAATTTTAAAGVSSSLTNDGLDEASSAAADKVDPQQQHQTEEQQQQQQDVQQNEEEEEINNKDLENSTAKKKTTRKKRSLNWEEAERGLLVEVVKPKVDCVENRSVDAKSIKSKRLAWLQITKQFNSLNFRQRSLEQIQVQWRAMKNAAKRDFQQKNPKEDQLEGLKLVEFIEDMHKDPEIGRSHSRGNVTAKEKKVLTDLDDDDDDDDTPLASLPTSANSNSEDTLQTSTMALPSPPLSGDSHNEVPPPARAGTAGAKKKATKAKGKARKNAINKMDFDDEALVVVEKPRKTKRQRSQEQTISSDDEKPIIAAKTEDSTLNPSLSLSSTFHPDDEKLKKQYFELLKRARLTEMDYARREHEQRMRFSQIEQDIKMHFIRQEKELHLLHQREEHEKRLQMIQTEHEIRMKIYNSAATNMMEENPNKNLPNSY